MSTKSISCVRCGRPCQMFDALCSTCRGVAVAETDQVRVSGRTRPGVRAGIKAAANAIGTAALAVGGLGRGLIPSHSFLHRTRKF